MTAREYLERLRTIDRDINAMLDHKQEMLEQAISIKSMPDGMCVQTSTSSRVEAAAIKLADYGDEINSSVDRLVDSKREAQRMIGQMQDSRFRSIPDLPVCIQLAVGEDYGANELRDSTNIQAARIRLA